MSSAATPDLSFPAPDEVDGLFNWDRMHAPRPLSPLAQDLVARTLCMGFTDAYGELGSPLQMSPMFVHGYYFSRTRAIEDPDERARRVEGYLAGVDGHLERLGAQWNEEWKPWLATNVEAELALDLAALADDDLLPGLDRRAAELRDKWRIHGRINMSLVSAARFVDHYVAELSPEDPGEALEALQGFHTRSVDASIALWDLGRVLVAHPELRALFDEGRVPDRSEMKAAPGGIEFVAKLDEALEEFGWRSDAVYDIADPTWIENPTVALRTAAAYAGQDETSDPRRRSAAAAQRRESLLAAARRRLEGEALERFEYLYDNARHNNPITEDHAFWIDQRSVALLRRYAQEIGRRLVERGVFDEIDDVFMLHRPELDGLLEKAADRRALVEERRVALARANEVAPPLRLGTPPPPPDYFDPLIDALRVRFQGVKEIPHLSDPSMVPGLAGAPGVAEGTARVVRSLDEASRLAPGEVMVCEMTLPPWVPLFALAAAVVADTGGELSHCAIVAREFAIPAVVGTLTGTRTIPDGARVRVDGTKGLVEILD